MTKSRPTAPMIRAIFLGGLLLLLLLGLLLLYRVILQKIQTRQEIQERKMEHDERKELFEDEDL